MIGRGEEGRSERKRCGEGKRRRKEMNGRETKEIWEGERGGER